MKKQCMMKVAILLFVLAFGASAAQRSRIEEDRA